MAAMIAKVWAEDFGKWNVVVNCASETKYSQNEQVCFILFVKHKVYPPVSFSLSLSLSLSHSLTHSLTQCGQVYKENIVDVATKNAAEAAKHNANVWIELSTGQVYASDKKPRDEEAKMKPVRLFVCQLFACSRSQQ